MDNKEKDYSITVKKQSKTIETDYKIEAVSSPAPSKNKQETLPKDPLETLPDVSSQTAGLPIVVFVLICLAAGSVMMIQKIITSSSVLITVFGALVTIILIFGIVALIRGMFIKLHQQNEKQIWYPLSAIVMAIAILSGVVIGILYCF